MISVGGGNEAKGNKKSIVVSAKEADLYEYRTRAQLGSRRERRRTPRHLWLKSKIRVAKQVKKL